MEKFKKFISKKKNQHYLTICFIVLFGFCLYASGVFSSNTGENQTELNTSLPEPEDVPLPENKTTAYEELEYIDGRLNTLEDELASQEDLVNIKKTNNPESVDQMHTRAIHASTQAEQVAAKTAAMQYTNYTHSAEREEYEAKLRDMEIQLATAQKIQSVQADAIEVANNSRNEISLPVNTEQPSGVNLMHATVNPISTEKNKVVSSLKQGGFYGTSMTEKKQKNTISASVYGKQVVRSGQNLRMRIMEPMEVGGHIIPTRSILIGQVQVGIDRLMIEVKSVEYGGALMFINLAAFDIDGQLGLYLPGSMEQDALKEIGAEMASSVANASSQSIATYQSTPNAAEQIKTDLGRGLITGTGNYISKKLNDIKVTVQDSHKLFLVIL